jgi:hypothetical protein
MSFKVSKIDLDKIWCHRITLPEVKEIIKFNWRFVSLVFFGRPNSSRVGEDPHPHISELCS